MLIPAVVLGINSQVDYVTENEKRLWGSHLNTGLSGMMRFSHALAPMPTAPRGWALCQPCYRRPTSVGSSSGPAQLISPGEPELTATLLSLERMQTRAGLKAGARH